MAYDNTYGNELRRLVTDPGSFQGTPGFQFALDSGLGAINRSQSRQRGSGNTLAALTKYGTGLAMQDYGNQFDRLQRANAGEQQYDLGRGQNANQATSIANQFTLGQQQNQNTATNNLFNYDLGKQRNRNDWGLGWMNANTNWANVMGQNDQRRSSTAMDWMRFLN